MSGREKRHSRNACLWREPCELPVEGGKALAVTSLRRMQRVGKVQARFINLQCALHQHRVERIDVFQGQQVAQACRDHSGL